MVHQTQGNETKELPKFFISVLHTQYGRKWHSDQPCRGDDVDVAIRQPELVVVDACSGRGAVPCFVYGRALQERHEAAGRVVAGDYKRKKVVDCTRDADGPGDGAAEYMHVHHANGELCATGLHLEEDLVEERELRAGQLAAMSWIRVNLRV